MGLRTQRYGPTATNCRGASHGPGVPRPTVANIHWHLAYNAIPPTISTTAVQTTGRGVAPPRVRISHGAYTAPAPGTTSVNRTFRSARRIGDQSPGKRFRLEFPGIARVSRPGAT